MMVDPILSTRTRIGSPCLGVCTHCDPISIPFSPPAPVPYLAGEWVGDVGLVAAVDEDHRLLGRRVSVEMSVEMSVVAYWVAVRAVPQARRPNHHARKGLTAAPTAAARRALVTKGTFPRLISTTRPLPRCTHMCTHGCG
jgi:hypothetical protein